jgi:hypothetical protein
MSIWGCRLPRGTRSRSGISRQTEEPKQSNSQSPITTNTMTESINSWLLQLPPEVLLHRLVKHYLTIPEIAALQSTCRFLHDNIGLVPLPPRQLFPPEAETDDDDDEEEEQGERTNEAQVHVHVNVGGGGDQAAAAAAHPFGAWIMQQQQQRAWQLRPRAQGDQDDVLQPLCRLRPFYIPSQQVHSCQVLVKWCDQGWGNRKGQVHVVARPEAAATAAAADDVLYGGTVLATSDLAPHTVGTTILSFGVEPLVEYYLYATVGSGGGHALLLYQVDLRTVLFDNSQTATTTRRVAAAYPALAASQGGRASPWIRHPRRLLVNTAAWQQEQAFMRLRAAPNCPHVGGCSGVVMPRGALGYPVKQPITEPAANCFSLDLLLHTLRSGTSTTPPAADLQQLLSSYGLDWNQADALQLLVQAARDEHLELARELAWRQQQRRCELAAKAQAAAQQNGRRRAADAPPAGWHVNGRRVQILRTGAAGAAGAAAGAGDPPPELQQFLQQMEQLAGRAAAAAQPGGAPPGAPQPAAPVAGAGAAAAGVAAGPGGGGGVAAGLAEPAPPGGGGGGLPLFLLNLIQGQMQAVAGMPGGITVVAGFEDMQEPPAAAAAAAAPDAAAPAQAQAAAATDPTVETVPMEEEEMPDAAAAAAAAPTNFFDFMMRGAMAAATAENGQAPVQVWGHMMNQDEIEEVD